VTLAIIRDYLRSIAEGRASATSVFVAMVIIEAVMILFVLTVWALAKYLGG
jgi:hypothetical protein